MNTKEKALKCSTNFNIDGDVVENDKSQRSSEM
jgi:hypothetical protein